MKDKHTDTRGKDLLFQHYLVVFVDILGQRRSLREIKELPTNDTEKDGFIKKIQATIGKVNVVRKAFRSVFDAAESHTPDTNLVPPEHREEFIASQKSEVYFYGFSDSIIIAVPLKVFNPQGKPIGHIHLPERCANLCFGGLKRNRLFMAASHSLYSLYVETEGAV